MTISRHSEVRSIRTNLLRLLLFLLVLLAGCEGSDETSEVEIRPVRVVTVGQQSSGDTVSLTGTIQAETEVNLAFRIDGRMIERSASIGNRVEEGDVIARLDPKDEENTLRIAQSELTASMGQLAEAQNNYERQKSLLENGWTTRVRYDEARQVLKTAQSRADAAQAQLNIAKNRLSFTELIADAPGIVTEVGGEPGEVVRSGQMIVEVAREDGRDAVFDVPAQIKDTAPADPEIKVVLTMNPAVMAVGRVREVASRADPVTGTFEVKVGLTDPPKAMRLGSTVSGKMKIGAASGIELPPSALTTANQQPAVWIVDPTSKQVSLRNIEVVRHDVARVLVGNGLETGNIVVTAGVQALRPGQKVRLLGEAQ